MPSTPGRNGDSHTSTSWRRPSNGGQPQDDAGAVPPTPLAASLHALPLHRRVRADRADLEAAYDAAHLLVCPSCALPRNDEDAAGRYHAPTCRCCGGTLVPLVEAPALPPPLEFRRPGGPGRVVSRLPRTALNN